MAKRLTGLNILGYTGVEATSPPNSVSHIYPPTSTDSQNFNIGDLWNVNNASLVQPMQVWTLTGLAGGVATWSQIYPFPTLIAGANIILDVLPGQITISAAGGGGGGAVNFETDAGAAVENAGTIDIFGGDNINTSGAGQAVTINLNPSINLSGDIEADGTITAGGGLTVSSGNVTFSELTNGVILSNDAGLLSFSQPGDPGTVLTSNGADAVPTWQLGGGGGDHGINFMAYQTANAVGVIPAIAPNVIPLGSVGGAAGIFITQFNNGGGAIVLGDGAGTPFSYTVPVAGTYLFQATANFTTTGSQGGISIVTPTRTYTPRTWTFVGGGAAQVQYSSSNLFTMAAGDVVTFNFTQLQNGGGNINGGNAPIVTSVAGSLQGAVEFASPTSTAFLAHQSGNTTVDITGDSTVVQIGASGGAGAIFAVDYNLGGGTIDIGDGAGTPFSYTAPVSGTYNFFIQATTTDIENATQTYVQITTPTNIYVSNFLPTNDGGNSHYSGAISTSALVQLNTGDEVTFQFAANQAAPVANVGLVGGTAPEETYIYGFLNTPALVGEPGDTNFLATLRSPGVGVNFPNNSAPIQLGAFGGGGGIYTQVFNNGGGVLVLGDGAATPLSYTVPVDGVYEFFVCVSIHENLGSDAGQASYFVTISTPGGGVITSQTANVKWPAPMSLVYPSATASGIFDMTAGDQVTFSFGILYINSAPRLQGADAVRISYMYGKRIS